MKRSLSSPASKPRGFGSDGAIAETRHLSLCHSHELSSGTSAKKAIAQQHLKRPPVESCRSPRPNLLPYAAPTDTSTQPKPPFPLHQPRATSPHRPETSPHPLWPPPPRSNYPPQYAEGSGGAGRGELGRVRGCGLASSAHAEKKRRRLGMGRRGGSTQREWSPSRRVDAVCRASTRVL